MTGKTAGGSYGEGMEVHHPPAVSPELRSVLESVLSEAATEEAQAKHVELWLVRAAVALFPTAMILLLLGAMDYSLVALGFSIATGFGSMGFGDMKGKASERLSRWRRDVERRGLRIEWEAVDNFRFATLKKRRGLRAD